MFRNDCLGIFLIGTLFFSFVDTVAFAAAGPSLGELLVTDSEKDFLKKFVDLVTKIRTFIGNERFDEIRKRALSGGIVFEALVIYGMPLR